MDQKDYTNELINTADSLIIDYMDHNESEHTTNNGNLDMLVANITEIAEHFEESALKKFNLIDWFSSKETSLPDYPTLNECSKISHINNNEKSEDKLSSITSDHSDSMKRSQISNIMNNEKSSKKRTKASKISNNEKSSKKRTKASKISNNEKSEDKFSSDAI